MVKTSLLLLVFNGENYINRALNSVYNQTKKIDEIVIINDASNDNTSDLVHSWKNKLPIIEIYNKENIGIFKSLKQGIDKCSGDLIFRIDHDDEWLENHVEIILNLFKKEKKISLYASRAIYLDKSYKFIKESEIVSDKNIRKRLLWDNPLVQSSTAFLKEDFLKVFCPSKMYSSEDYDLWIKLLNIGELSFSPIKSVNYFVYDNSLSRRNIKRNFEERFNCQLNAIRKFYFLYPLRSSFIFIILMMRIILLKILN